MTAKQLLWIKQKQKEYFELFKEKLKIDFSEELICNKTEKVREIFKECMLKYNPDLQIIRNKRLRLSHESRENERNFVGEFSRKVLNLKLNIAEAARLLNKDRSNIYHYAKK